MYGILTVNAADTISVYGYFTYSGNPIKYARVEVRESDPGFDDHLAWGYTDENGYYHISGIPNDDGWLSGGNDVFVKCYAYNDAVNVLGNPEWMPDRVWEGCTYSFRTSTKSDRQDGSSTNMGSEDAPSDVREAFSVFDIVTKGWYFMRSVLGANPPRINAFWDDTFAAGVSYYMPWSAADKYSLNEWWWLLTFGVVGDLPAIVFNMASQEVLKSLRGIHIVDGDGWKPEIVLHEYGHYIMDHYADFWPPNTDMHHNYLDVKYPQHAWGEGWAEFFSGVAAKECGYSKNTWLYGNGVSLEMNYNGSNVEGAVAGLLWDIYDDSSMYSGDYVDNDNVTRSFTTIFNVMRNYNPAGARDHIWDVYDLFMGFFEEDHWTLQDVYDVYTLHGIDPGVPAAPTLLVSPNNQYLDLSSDTSASYSITVTNVASTQDSYELEVSPRFSESYFEYYFSYEKELTIGPNQAAATTLIVNILNFNQEACILGTDPFLVKVTSKTTGFDESVTCLLQVDFQPTCFSVPQGGLAVKISPKRIHLIEEPKDFEVTIYNNQNFDDVIYVKQDLDGILSEYQALGYWIRYEEDYDGWYAMVWDEDRVYIPAKSSFTLQLSVNTNLYVLFYGTTKTLWATWNPKNENDFRVFKITATSQLNPSVKAQDAGIISKEVP